MEVSIGQDAGGSPVVFVKGRNPKKVAEAYLKTKSIVSPSVRDLMIKMKKKEAKTK